MKKKKLILTVNVIMLIALIGISYAWLTNTIFGKKEYILKAGELDLILNETSNGLILENALPVTDSIGLQSEGATFSIRNNSQNDICYKLYLDDSPLNEDEIRIDDRFIKYSLNKNQRTGIPKVFGETSEERLLDSGKIKAQDQIHYNLKLWLNVEIDGEYAAHIFKGKLRIEAIQCDTQNLPIMRAYTKDSTQDYHAEEYREKITSITTKKDVNIPSTAINSWDVSEAADKSVIAYVEDDGLGGYSVTIGGQGGIKANKDSSFLFYNFKKVTTIQLGYLNTSDVTNMYAMFHTMESIKTIDLTMFDTSNVTSMYAMFHNCYELKTLDLTSFDTSNLVNMRAMFGNCPKLETVDLSSFDTSKVTEMQGLFILCSSLKEINMHNLDTSNVESMREMFYNCSSLKSINITNFNTSKVTNMYAMFYGCSSLERLNLTSFNITNVTDAQLMFSECTVLNEILVSNTWITQNVNITNMFLNCGIDRVTMI